MSEQLKRWIEATHSCITAALAAPADTERLLEAFCAIDAVASVAMLLDTELDAPEDAEEGDVGRDALGWLALGASERRALIARGKLAMGPASQAAPENESDEALALRLARSGATRGLARLTGAGLKGAGLKGAGLKGAGLKGAGLTSSALTEVVHHDVARLPEQTLLRLVRGELDGFRAQEVARRIAASAEARSELRLLVGLSSGAPVSPKMMTWPTLRLAADGPAEVRDPSKGRPVGSLRAVTSEGPLELEAVRFEDGVLGIYASRAVPLVLAGSSDGSSLSASSIRVWTVRGSAPGYLELDDAPDAGEHTELALRIEDRDAILTLRS